MEFWKVITGYEACISQIRRQKTNLKSRPQGWFKSIQVRNIGNNQQENSQIERTKIPQAQQ
jgi:hypothetical protein